MPRMARVVVPGYPHHVTQRGNRRQRVFLQTDDWDRYLKLVREACVRADTRVLAYCLMPNHVHFVMVPAQEDGLRAAMADAHRRYTRAVNARQGWRGHLWQERFYSVVMEEPHLRAAIPYVERNPVRAALCDAVHEWPWSSAVDPGVNEANGLVDWPLRESLLGGTPSPNRRSHDDEDAIRLHTRTGRPLGGAAFLEMLEARTGRRLRPSRRGRPPTANR